MRNFLNRFILFNLLLSLLVFGCVQQSVDTEMEEGLIEDEVAVEVEPELGPGLKTEEEDKKTADEEIKEQSLSEEEMLVILW